MQQQYVPTHTIPQKKKNPLKFFYPQKIICPYTFVQTFVFRGTVKFSQSQAKLCKDRLGQPAVS